VGRLLPEGQVWLLLIAAGTFVKGNAHADDQGTRVSQRLCREDRGTHMISRTPGLSKVTVNDLPAILALLRSCELLESGVAEAIDEFLVARADATLLGCAGLEAYGDLGLLRSVAVEARARKSGLGRELVEGVVASARARRIRELFLLTTTASGFFEQLGFVVVARNAVPTAIAESWEFRVGCPQTALPMRLALGESP